MRTPGYEKNAGWFTPEKSYRREEVAELLRIDEDTVTNYTKKYDKSGLAGLLEENYHRPKINWSPIQSS